MKDYLYLRACQGRAALSENDLASLHRDGLGKEGESYVQTVVASLDDLNACTLFDVWLHCYDTTQIDTLIVLPNRIYLINVKNYQMILHSEDEFSQEISQKISHQLDYSRRILEKILRHLGVKIPIETVVMFTNTNQLDPIPEPHPDTVVLSHEMTFWFRKIMRQEEGWRSMRRLKEVISGILTFECEPIVSDQKPALTHEEVRIQLECGLRCIKCRAVNQMVDETQRMITCSCGHRASKEEVVLASIDEYLALRKTTCFTRLQVEEFLVDVNKSTLKRLLRKHFYLVGKGRASYYKITTE